MTAERFATPISPLFSSFVSPVSAAPRRLLAAFIAAALLAACSKPAPPAAEVRPVRTMTLAAASAGSSAEFSGDVRPRYESRLGFRVGGKISARKVDIGSTVKRGQVLMQLDPQDLRLGQAQAQASLRAAQTNLELAQAELKRYQDLRAQNFVAQAVLDQKIASARSSQATVEQARAALSEQANQTGYASLVSDTDGVVTAIDAEVGQVVAAGTPVVRVARTDEKEVVIGVPEDQVQALRKVSEVKVRLWADPNQSIPGTIREVSPMADPATRTYMVKVTVPAREDVRLGMTAVVQLVHRAGAGDASQLKVPLSALVQDKGVSSVWVVENGAVRLVPVRVGGVAGNEVVLARGEGRDQLRPGQVIVTAGVNLLKNGQKVKILTADVARRGDAEAEAAGRADAGGAPAAAADGVSGGSAAAGAAAAGGPVAGGPAAPATAAGSLAGAGPAPAAPAVGVPVAGATAAGAALGAAALAAALPAKDDAKAVAGQSERPAAQQAALDAGKPVAKAGKKPERTPARKEAARRPRKPAEKRSAKQAAKQAPKHAARRGDKASAKRSDKHGRKHAAASAGAAQ